MLETHEQNTAATALQSSFRGMKSRSAYKGKKKKQQREQEREAAATSMQSAFRGSAARRKSVAERQIREERERNKAATSLQSAFRGANVRKGASRHCKSHLGSDKNVGQGDANLSSARAKNKPSLIAFEGTLNRIFCVKGVYFEKTRVFGTVNVQIVDPAALTESMKRGGAGESAGLIRARSKKSASGGAAGELRPEAPKNKSRKRRGSVRRRHSIRPNAGATASVRRDNTLGVSGPRQLLFTVYIPMGGQEFKIYVSKADVMASFEKELATSLIRVSPFVVVVARYVEIFVVVVVVVETPCQRMHRHTTHTRTLTLTSPATPGPSKIPQ